MSKITLWGHIDIPSEDLEAVVAALPEHVALSRNEKGCLCFEIAQDALVATRFHVFEEFQNAKAFDDHQARVQNSAWGKITTRAVRQYKKEVRSDDTTVHNRNGV